RAVRDAPHTLELTPARHALRQAIARCDRARREADAAAIVVGRLNAITDEHAATAIGNSRRTGKTIPIRPRSVTRPDDWMILVCPPGAEKRRGRVILFIFRPKGMPMT